MARAGEGPKALVRRCKDCDGGAATQLVTQLGLKRIEDLVWTAFPMGDPTPEQFDALSDGFFLAQQSRKDKT